VVVFNGLEVWAGWIRDLGRRRGRDYYKRFEVKEKGKKSLLQGCEEKLGEKA